MEIWSKTHAKIEIDRKKPLKLKPKTQRGWQIHYLFYLPTLGRISKPVQCCEITYNVAWKS